MEAARREDEKARMLKADTRTISANLSSSVLARGDRLVITGAVTGSPPPEIAIWIFGDEFRFYDSVPVEVGNTFQYTLPRP